jgi:hypothetical protein
MTDRCPGLKRCGACAAVTGLRRGADHATAWRRSVQGQPEPSAVARRAQLGSSILRSLNQFVRPLVEGYGQSFDRPYRRRYPPKLDQGHLIPTQLGVICKLLLGPAPCQPFLPDYNAEGGLKAAPTSRTRRHVPKARGLYSQRLPIYWAGYSRRRRPMIDSGSAANGPEAVFGSDSVAAAPQQPLVPRLRGPAFWARVAAVVAYVPAIVLVVISSTSTPSGGQQPWYGNVGTAILVVLVLVGLLTDTRFMGTMGGVIRWNRMKGWQKALVGFFYFFGLLPLGIGVFFAVSLLRQRYPEAFARTTPSTGSASSPTSQAPIAPGPIWPPAPVPASLRSGPPVATEGSVPASVSTSEASDGERTLIEVGPVMKLGTLIAICCTLGLYAIWRAKQRYIVTTRRIIVRRGLFHTDERSYPLNRIQNVDSQQAIRQGRLTIATDRGAIVIGHLKRADAKRVADILNPLIRPYA